MRVFRKVVMPIVWAAIFATIAVSLAVMAFGSDDKPAESGLKPTGKIPVTNAGVSRGTVSNTLRIKGTIKVDAPVPVKADHAGVINHFFVPAGAKVRVGDPLFQVRSEVEGSADETDGDGKAPKPATRYYTVVATEAGKASFAKALGDEVSKGDAVGSIHLQTYKASGTISPVDQYRLSDKPSKATVTITGGPAPFTCLDLSVGDTVASNTSSGSEGNGSAGFDPNVGPSEGGDSESGGAAITCRVPDDVKVFDGLDMTMAIDAGRAEDVLVVPVTAVRGLVGKGTVWVVDGGKPTPTAVTLGLSDGKVVEIKKGLKEVDEILEFVPGDSGAGSGSAELEGNG